MNCIVRKDHEGIVNEFHLADGFYQKEYDFGNTEVDIEKLAYGKKVSVTKKGEQDVSLKPTAYSGPRNQYDRGNEDLFYCGVPVTSRLTADDIIDIKGNKDIFFEELGKWSYD